MAAASAGQYANNLHLAPERSPHQHLITQFFTGQVLFLTLTNSDKALMAHKKRNKCM